MFKSIYTQLIKKLRKNFPMSFFEKKRTKRSLIDEFDFVKYNEILIEDSQYKTLDQYIKDTQYTFSICIHQNTSISTIPDAFPNLYELQLYDTFVERILCNSLRHINIDKNYEIKYINDILQLRTIVLNRCINLIQINNKNVQSIVAKNCNKLESINNTIKLETIELYHCPKILQFNSLSCLKQLRLVKCNNIVYLDNFPNLTHLFIDNCRNIVKISTLMNVRCMEIINCEKLNTISNIGHIENAYINDCIELKTLEKITSITHLKLVSCALQNISNISIYECSIKNSLLASMDIQISELELLSFLYCTRLHKIKVQAFSLKRLDIKECSNLTEIFSKNKTQMDKMSIILHGGLDIKKILTNHRFKLSIDYNNQIRKIKGIEMIDELSITSCHHLSTIDKLNNIQKFSVRDCPVLQCISDITGIEYLNINSCPSLIVINCFFSILRILIIENCPKLGQVINNTQIHKVFIKNSGIILFDSDFSNTSYIETEDTAIYGSLKTLQEFLELNQKAIQNIKCIQKYIRSYIIHKYKNNPSTLTVSDACSICLVPFLESSKKQKSITMCLHSFHLECLKRWFKESTVCPICKNPCVF